MASMAASAPLDLLFLGSGNAFGDGGRAFSSFLLNGAYLFDCGPTLLPQLRRAGASPAEIEVVFISHFHADHFFGLPFLLLDGKYRGRGKDIYIVGPPGIGELSEQLLRIGYPGVQAAPLPFERRYVEVHDGFEATIGGLKVRALRVEHVAEMECFAYRVELGGRSLAYSGDSTLCPALLRLVDGAEVVVLECSCEGVAVHLSPADVASVAREVPGAHIVLTHLDGERPAGLDGLHLATDLARFSF